MNSVTSLSKQNSVPKYSNEQVAYILSYLAATTSNEALSDNATIGLSVLLKSLSYALVSEC
ncbi:hypothetical protein [Photobacterium kishitanii]|uniref:hypothetical protein n=1 Tax=Photobacterium kishitanii TaxID=318456 RepID=UPI000A7304E0|nr:hypothetical protein [Photobacterium kishitanii]